MSYNKVIFIGNLTKDPELRYTPQGTPVANFRIAVNEKISKEKKETLFIDVVTFGKSAEACSEYLVKGKAALVEGRLTERKWESDGVMRSKFEVIAGTVRFLSGKSSNGETAESHSSEYPEEAMAGVEPW